MATGTIHMVTGTTSITSTSAHGNAMTTASVTTHTTSTSKVPSSSASPAVSMKEVPYSIAMAHWIDGFVRDLICGDVSMGIEHEREYELLNRLTKLTLILYIFVTTALCVGMLHFFYSMDYCWKLGCWFEV